MEALFRALDVFVYAVGIIGGAAAIYWIYNSTNKERRALLRHKGPGGNPAFARVIRQGILVQRLAFAAAAVVTSGGILWFALAYHRKFHALISPAYFVVAGALAAAGVATAVVSWVKWRQTGRKE